MTSSGRRPQLGTLRALVAAAGDDALRRASRRSPAWWRAETAPGRTRAHAVADLVAALAACGQRAEGITSPRTPPAPPRAEVLADQLAVVLRDLVLALEAPQAPDAGRVAAEALAHCLVRTHEYDPRPVPERLVEAALAGEPGPLRDLVERLPRQRER